MTHSHTPPAERPPQIDDLQFITSGYRLVSDDTAFSECILAWTRKISEAEKSSVDPLVDEDAIVREYIRGVKGLLEKLNGPENKNPIDEVVSEVDAAAMVLNARGTVVSANADAGRRFKAIQGQENKLQWLDPFSSQDFESVRTGLRSPSPRQHAIVRTIDRKSMPGMAEVFTLPSENPGSFFIVVRALETRWAAQVDETLKRAFGLTGAEQAVARALYETRDTAQIAKLRDTTTQTIRTQIRTILRKTETNSQVDLVRLLGLLNARAGHKRRAEPMLWQDPWDHYTIIRPNGGKALAYSWIGPEDGVPALIVHGVAQGYILGKHVENRIKDAGIRLYAIIRPGFGGSDSCAQGDYFAGQADAILSLMAELGLKNIPAIGLGNGSVSLLKAAAQDADLFTRLLITGVLQPFSAAAIARLTPTQKILAKLPRYAPKTTETLARVCMRYVQEKGADWYLTNGWKDVPEVRDTLSNPEIIPFIRNASELALTADVKTWLCEMQSQWYMDTDLAAKVGCPIAHLHGEYDRSVTADDAAKLSAKAAHFSSEQINGAGYFLVYEKPQIFADRLIKTILGRS